MYRFVSHGSKVQVLYQFSWIHVESTTDHTSWRARFFGTQNTYFRECPLLSIFQQSGVKCSILMYQACFGLKGYVIFLVIRKLFIRILPALRCMSHFFVWLKKKRCGLLVRPSCFASQPENSMLNALNESINHQTIISITIFRTSLCHLLVYPRCLRARNQPKVLLSSFDLVIN